MMSYGGTNLFASGPAELRTGRLRRRTDRRSLAGQNGQLAMDLGRDSRAIEQTGRLQADTLEDLQALIDAIEVRLDGQVRSLVAPSGASHDCLIEEFELTRGPARGRGFWCEYRILYRELTP